MSKENPQRDGADRLPSEIFVIILSSCPDDWGNLRLTCKTLNNLVALDSLCVCPVRHDEDRTIAITCNPKLSQRVTSVKIYPLGLPRLHNVFQYQDAAKAQEQETLDWYEEASGECLQETNPLTTCARYKHLLQEQSVSIIVQD